MMTVVFEKQIGNQFEVYVDDLLVKIKHTSQHRQHLVEVFGMLHEFWIKLNLTKCVFGVTSRKFLGHLVTKRGIEANLNQI